jgi:hypothetical protein
MKTSNWLAKIFDWNREVIEAAETPFAKLAIFILPILSPVVPAVFTGLHVYKLMQVIFGAGLISKGTAVIVAIVLELLGYVGVVSFIQDVYKWVKTRKDEYLVPAILNGLAYGFYLVAMYFINFLLGQYFNTPEIVNKIVGLLSFITVPTGLLAANHLSSKAEYEENKNLRREKQEFKLKEKAIKNGINPFGGQSEQQPRKMSEKHASDFKERIPVMLQEHYAKSGKVMELTEITAKLKLDHAKNKGFVSTERSKWMSQNGINKNGEKNGLTF